MERQSKYSINRSSLVIDENRSLEHPTIELMKARRSEGSVREERTDPHQLAMVVVEYGRFRGAASMAELVALQTLGFAHTIDRAFRRSILEVNEALDRGFDHILVVLDTASYDDPKRATQEELTVLERVRSGQIDLFRRPNILAVSPYGISEPGFFIGPKSKRKMMDRITKVTNDQFS